MTILILLHRSKFVAQAVPRRRLRLCIDSLFRRKGFTSRCRSAQPKYFRQAISRQLQGNYWVKIEEQGESHLVFLITWIRSTVVGIKVTYRERVRRFGKPAAARSSIGGVRHSIAMLGEGVQVGYVVKTFKQRSEIELSTMEYRWMHPGSRCP